MGFLKKSSRSEIIVELDFLFTIPYPLSFPVALTVSVKLHPGQLKALFNTSLMMFSIGFPILSYPIWQHATSIGYTKQYAKNMPSQATPIYNQAIYR